MEKLCCVVVEAAGAQVVEEGDEKCLHPVVALAGDLLDRVLQTEA